MKKNRWIFLVLISLLYLYFIKFPVIIDNCKYEGNFAFSSMKKGVKFRLSDKIGLSDGKKYRMVLIIQDRGDVPISFPSGKIFTTSDQKLIKNFLNIKFNYTASDITTVESEIFIYENNKCILRSGILVNREGLQSPDFGWIESVEKEAISSLLEKLNRNYSPLIILK